MREIAKAKEYMTIVPWDQTKGGAEDNRTDAFSNGNFWMMENKATVNDNILWTMENLIARIEVGK